MFKFLSIADEEVTTVSPSNDTTTLLREPESDTVPIIVGSVLAVIIAIVLISYVFVRIRRWNYRYEMNLNKVK